MANGRVIEEPLNVSFGPGGLPLPQAQPRVPMGLIGLPTGGGLTLPPMPAPQRPGVAEGLFQMLEGVGSGLAGLPDPAIERRKAAQVAEQMALERQRLGLTAQDLDLRRQDLGFRRGVEGRKGAFGEAEMFLKYGLTGEPLQRALKGIQEDYRRQGVTISDEHLRAIGGAPEKLLALTDPEFLAGLSPQQRQGLPRLLLTSEGKKQYDVLVERFYLRAAEGDIQALTNAGIAAPEARRRVAGSPRFAPYRKSLLEGIGTEPELSAKEQTQAAARPQAGLLADMVAKGEIPPEVGAARIAGLGLDPKDFMGPALTGATEAAKRKAGAQALEAPITPGGPTVGDIEAKYKGRERGESMVDLARAAASGDRNAAQALAGLKPDRESRTELLKNLGLRKQGRAVTDPEIQALTPAQAGTMMQDLTRSDFLSQLFGLTPGGAPPPRRLGTPQEEADRFLRERRK